MKYLKEVDIPDLYKTALVEYAEFKDIDLEEKINSILTEQVEKLYKSIVPTERQKLIEKKLSKEKKVVKPMPKPAISQPTMLK